MKEVESIVLFAFLLIAIICTTVTAIFTDSDEQHIIDQPVTCEYFVTDSIDGVVYTLTVNVTAIDSTNSLHCTASSAQDFLLYSTLQYFAKRQETQQIFIINNCDSTTTK